MSAQDFQDNHTGTYIDQHKREWIIEPLQNDLGIIKRPIYGIPIATEYNLKEVKEELYLTVDSTTYLILDTEEGVDLVSGDAVCYYLQRAT